MSDRGSDSDEPGDDKVSERTRLFEQRDAQVPAGAGPGPTPAESDVADKSPRVADHTREAYREMVWRGAYTRGAGRLP